MASIYKAEEWEIVGRWYCNDQSNLKGINGKWWVPARILGMAPAAYIEWLYNTFKPDHLEYLPKGDVLIFWWHNQADMRKYKNYINAAARKSKVRL